MAQLPDFQTLDEEIAFWESQDSSAYCKNMEEVTLEVDLHQNLLHPKIVVLTEQPEHCPRCRNDLEGVVIRYVAWKNGEIVVIRDVPALRCQARGHEYILESTLDRIERLFDLEKTQKLKPAETIHVPVFSLNIAA